MQVFDTYIWISDMHIGILSLGRSTFDVEYAIEKLAAMYVVLEQSGHKISGSNLLLCDEAECEKALLEMQKKTLDIVLILQVTFTDAKFVIQVANTFKQLPLAIWAVPEPRIGGRLRLNAFCGLILASHALGLNQRKFSYLYHHPSADDVGQVFENLLNGKYQTVKNLGNKVQNNCQTLAPELQHLRIARIGQHPDGFDTCRYDKQALQKLMGIEIDELDLEDLFQNAKDLSPATVEYYRKQVGSELKNLSSLDSGEVERSIRLAGALDKLAKAGGYDAGAVRCWPETFTEYGSAICGPLSILGEARVPCACEADVYGAVSQTIMQHVADQPVFLVDLVDLSDQDNTGVIWHCGQAPVSMAADKTEVQATVHSNRKMALLYEFTLKTGRITLFRLSQAYGKTKLVIATGVVLARPMSFTGTSGVVQFDYSADIIFQAILDSGLEHHMVLAYGNFKQSLCDIAAAINLPVIILGEDG